MILAVNNLTKSYDGRDIIKNISFHIEARDRLAITGANGAGKTTLLKQLIGEEQPDSGSVSVSKDIRLGYLSQMPDIDGEKTIHDAVLEVKKDVLDMENELRRLEGMMKVSSDEELLKRYSELSHRFELENGYAVRSALILCRTRMGA